MKSVTVIWCDWKDEDTGLCQLMWKDLPDEIVLQVVHVNYWNHMMEKIVDLAITNESDTLLFCGHGTEHGLLVPKNYGTYVLHQYNANLIKAKNVVGMSCYGMEFAKSVGLHGLFSSMFISNINEATTIGIMNTSAEEIKQSNTNFYMLINRMLSGEITMEETFSKMKELGWNDSVSSFNADGMTIL